MPAGPEDPDAALMLCVKAGDDHAFSTLMEKYKRPILNLAYRYLGDPDEAEDLAQEVFVRVYRAAPRYRPSAKFSTWLYRIAINLCLDTKAKHRPIPESTLKYNEDSPSPLALAADPGPSPATLAEHAELTRVIQGALAQLHARERLAVILARYKGSSLEEIADTLGTSVGAVKSLLHRAKAKLQKILTPYLQE